MLKYEKNISLNSSPVRIGLPFHPVPSSVGMIKDYYLMEKITI